MLWLTAKRLVMAVPVVIAVALITFFMIQLVPGSPAAALLGETATPQQIAQLEHQLGLDRPVWVQFADWAFHAVQGDLGNSYVNSVPVTETLSLSLPPTLALAVGSTILTLLVGYVMGMAAAIRGGWTDRIVQWICSLGMAVPNFWLATVLVAFLAIRLSLFPSGGYVGIDVSPGQWFSHLILPIVALSISNLGQIAFQARAATQTALSKDYVRTLQANGVRRSSVLFKHVLRNSSIPVITVIGLQFVFTLGGVVIIEIVFSYPGLGQTMLKAVQTNDFSVVLGGVLYFSLVVVVVNLLIDFITAALDPRMRI